MTTACDIQVSLHLQLQLQLRLALRRALTHNYRCSAASDVAEADSDDSTALPRLRLSA